MKKELLLTGFLLLALIFFFIDFRKLFAILSRINLLLFFLGVLMGIPAVLARSAKWHLMLAEQGFEFPFLKIFKYYFIGIGLGSFTPGRIGDFAKVLFVNKKINSLSVSFSSILVDRIVDLSMLVFLGIVSSAVFVYFFGVAAVSITVIALLLLSLFAVFYLLFNKPLLKRFLKPFYRMLVPERFKGKLASGFDSFLSSTQALLRNPKLLGFSLALSFVSWLFTALAFYFLALSLGLGLSPFFILMVMSLSTIVLLLPLSVSGVGTRDALMIFLFSFRGISPEGAVAFSFLVLFSSLLISLLGVSFMVTEKLGLKEFLGEKS